MFSPPLHISGEGKEEGCSQNSAQIEGSSYFFPLLTISWFQNHSNGGFSGIKSLTTDKVFDKYFPASEVTNFEKFHIKFLQLCNDFNSGMLGQHFDVPSDEDIEKCYRDWSQKTTEERKKLVLELLNAHVKVIKTDDAILMTGLLAPPAAMMLKKSSQNVPQLKRFRLNLVPDIVFVPTFAVAALFTIKVLKRRTGLNDPTMAA